MASNGAQESSTFVGQLGQELDQNTSDKCQGARYVESVSGTGNALGIFIDNTWNSLNCI